MCGGGKSSSDYINSEKIGLRQKLDEFNHCKAKLKIMLNNSHYLRTLEGRSGMLKKLK